MTDTEFSWHADRFETISHRCTQLMLGLMGLALMLMMMNLASPLLLAPAALLILISHRLQRFCEQLTTEFEDAQIRLAPRTLLIQQPALNQERRLRYQDIEAVERFSRWRIEGIRLHIAGAEAPVELIGFDDQLLNAIEQRTPHRT